MKITEEDGKTVSVNKERILSELESIEPEYIQQVLEQEVGASEKPALGKQSPVSSLMVPKIKEFDPQPLTKLVD